LSKRLSRRELAGLVGAAALAGCAEASDKGAGAEAVQTPGLVGVAKLVLPESGKLPASAANQAMAAALQAATGKSSGEQAAAALFRPDDTVGIKVNCLAGPGLSPRVELVEALVELIAAAGVRRSKIIVFERSSRELKRAGYPLRLSGEPYLCHGIDNQWDLQPTTSGEIGSCYARLVSATCTALVSFGVVKDHDLAGVSAGLKNWYGVIHNPNKYHDNNCDPYVADVVRHPYIRSKLRLTVLDGMSAQCHGGPALRADTLFALGKVAASTDPVAIDVWAWLRIDEERKRRGLPSLEEAERPPRFIATAAAHGLGIGERQAIREVSG
jgi:uncharacterized protein (DUF362 family)